jgi:hypothetical protein
MTERKRTYQEPIRRICISIALKSVRADACQSADDQVGATIAAYLEHD